MTQGTDKTGRNLIHRERKSGAMFDLCGDQPVTASYADGLGNMMLGAAVTRLNFYSVTDIENDDSTSQPIEIREITASVILPTSALLNAVTFMVQNLSGNKDTLSKAIGDAADALRNQLSSIVKD